MLLDIKPGLEIPANELTWRFSRSSGSGGQSVNKTDSRVEVIFNIETSKIITSSQRNKLRARLKAQLRNGQIRVVAQDYRTQYQNRKLALKRLSTVIREALNHTTKTRKATTPSKSSQKQRVHSKRLHGELKKNRKEVNLNE